MSKISKKLTTNARILKDVFVVSFYVKYLLNIQILEQNKGQFFCI